MIPSVAFIIPLITLIKKIRERKAKRNQDAFQMIEDINISGHIINIITILIALINKIRKKKKARVNKHRKIFQLIKFLRNYR